ncbi:hypothetical protein N9D63_10115, partial [Opitutales bacterium]|nr:hypothetical protein [Opitutales bacterium]
SGCSAITFQGKIYVIGGHLNGLSNPYLDLVFSFDPIANEWSQKSAMPTPRYLHKLVVLGDEIWAIGGYNHLAGGHLNKVEIYDPAADSWTTAPSLSSARGGPSVWITNGKIFAAGGHGSNSYLNSIEVFDPTNNQWSLAGTIPEAKYGGDATTLNNKVYLVAGATGSNANSKKVFAADLPTPAMDLYFKDGNATAEAATAPSLDGNLTVTLNMLAPDALAKLDVDQTHAQSAGSVIAVPKDSSPPAGYSLYKRSDRNSSLVWEEKAPVSVARDANDGVIAYEGKMYFIGGYNGSGTNVTERYDPLTNQWQTLSPLTTARFAHSCTVLNDKIYAIGGNGLSSVEIYDPALDQWTAGTGLPGEVRYAEAITVGGKILLIGGRNSSSQNLSQVLEFDPSNNQWSQKTPMNTTRLGPALTYLDGKVWVLGGLGGAQGTNLNTVEIYDATADSWTTGPSFSVPRVHLTSWTANGRIYVAGGYNPWVDSIEVWEPSTNQWSDVGSLPESKSNLDSVVLHGKVYVVAGSRSSTDYSNKVFAADITPPMDLYFRDANVSGTITLDKFAGTVTAKLDGNASALPPIGAVSAVDHHDASPTDHAILERTDRNATHVWEEMAPVSVGRFAIDGVEEMGGNIYFVGGRNSDSGTSYNIAERYDPALNQWQSLTSMSTARAYVATSSLNGKLYAIGGSGQSSMEVFDPIS